MSDPFVDPRTGVLINTLGIDDQNLLDEIERQYAARRLASLPKFPATDEGYKALHRHIFQDIYPWAGQVRKIDISKLIAPATRVEFLKGAYVGVSLRRLFSQLERDNFLKGLDAKTFAFRAAVYARELNYIHPFREGNGRALRAFLKQLASQAGHELDLTRIRRAAWMRASETSLNPAMYRSVREEDYRHMSAVITGAMRGLKRGKGRGL
jgi:cell filamentation protein